MLYLNYKIPYYICTEFDIRSSISLLLLENVDELTEGFNAAIDEVAQKVLGKQSNKKQPWISNEALNLCDKRSDNKGKWKNGPAEAEEYSNTNKKVRTKLREDKETWINQQCETLETEITKNNTKKAFDSEKTN